MSSFSFSTLRTLLGSALDLVSSSVLYSPGAFFFYPWKPLMQALCGDTYQVGYTYFRRDHCEWTNLKLHLVALGWQLLGNFGLLAALDRQLVAAVLGGSTSTTLLGTARPLSAVTALLWSATLLRSPAPRVCSVLSTACIAGAYAAAPRLEPRALEFGAIAAFLTVLVASRRTATLKRGATDVANALAHLGLVVYPKP